MVLGQGKGLQLIVLVLFFLAVPALSPATAGHVAASLRPTTAGTNSLRAPLPGPEANRVFRLRASPQTPQLRLPAVAWSTNAQAVAIIKDAEKLRLKAYHLAGQWLIGYGHAGGVTPGMVITAERAENLLRGDVRICEHTVRSSVDVPVTRNEFSALVALCYNIGGAKFARSHVVMHLNQRDRAEAADAFLNWRRARIDDELRVAASLVHRRHKERALFLSPAPIGTEKDSI